MDIGSSIAVFLVLALVLLALFCFLTKYFHHKLQQTIQEAAEIYSMVDQVSVHSEVNEDEPGMAKSKTKKDGETPSAKDLFGKNKKKEDQDDMYVEMNDLRQPFNDKMDSYIPSILKQKLNDEYTPNKIDTKRSMASMKKFAPQKMNTNRSIFSAAGPLSTMRSQEDIHRENNITKHSYINKLVCYDCHGITVIQIQVVTIRKTKSGAIKEKKKIKTETVPTQDDEIAQQIQIYGFEEGVFSCYRYVTELSIENMRFEQDYAVKNLHSTVTRQNMQISDYIRIKMELNLV